MFLFSAKLKQYETKLSKNIGVTKISNRFLEDGEIKINPHELCRAIKNCDRNTFKKILTKADKTAKNGEYEGKTPLAIAIEEEKLDIVDILLEDGEIKINPHALCLATKNCNIETFKKVLEKANKTEKSWKYKSKALLNLEIIENRTLLKLAIKESRNDISDILLDLLRNQKKHYTSFETKSRMIKSEDEV